MGNLFTGTLGKVLTEGVGKVLTGTLGNVLTELLGKVLDIYTAFCCLPWPALLGIEAIDHIVAPKSSFFGFKEKALIKEKLTTIGYVMRQVDKRSNVAHNQNNLCSEKVADCFR